jgi:Abnormal spindle-like microcephaly-assoc'd, ASPM-SPD-2-Hydin
MANVSILGFYYLVIDDGSFTDDYKITPNLVLPETVIVNPNTIDAPWTLTGPNGYSTTGIGDQTLSNLPIGDYMIIWGDIPGWIKPSPATETKALTSGGTITFSGTYVQQAIPIIQVTPLSLNFNYVPVGSTKDLFLTVKNMGGGTLTGNATAEAPFSIFSGVSYSLGPDQSQVITVRYQPTSQGPHTGMVVFTGGDGATVSVTGKTEKPLGLPWLLLHLGN